MIEADNQPALETEAPNINLQDLQNLLHIVDVSAERGTFKGNELSSVGQVRDKLAIFLEAASKTEEAADAPSESSDDGTTSDTPEE